MTGIPKLDTAPQVLTQWLKELESTLEWTDRHRTYVLLRATLQTLRDFLRVDDAADLAAQLPVLLRGIYYEGWDPSRTPVYPRDKTAFMARIEAHFRDMPPDEIELAVEAVFDLISLKISTGEAEQVAHALRKPLQALWH